MTGGGGLWNSRSSRPTLHEQSSPLGGIGFLGLSYLWENRWEAGLRVGYRRYAHTHEGNYFFEEDFNPITGLATTTGHHMKFVEKMPAWAIAPFVNRHFGKGKMDFYAGLSPAYLRFIGPKVTDSTGYSTRLKGANGYGLDVQAGAAFRITPGFQLFAEGAGGIVNTPSYLERANIFTASLTLGMNLRMNN